MREIPHEQILRRLRAENPWWNPPHRVPDLFREWRPRPYLDLFFPLIESRVRRAVVLMGPRRVGKTVLLHHAIQRLLDREIDPRRICYLSVDHPLYTGLHLQQLLDLFAEATGSDLSRDSAFVFLDEIQYRRDWEIHLKSIVDSYPSLKCVASGSAAAALKLKSQESGAGRFTDFLLPPLTFHEYLVLIGEEHEIRYGPEPLPSLRSDPEQLNDRFLEYLNFGGYPEAVFSPEIQADPARFIKADILDKVLLRDLPSLYGIQDIQELNSLFTTLAFNTAGEVSLEQLAQSSGVAKNTIKKYIEYLDAAFLIRTVHRVDRDARQFKRANYFKVYLTNPSIRAALFAPAGPDDSDLGALVETGVFAQWLHSDVPLHYARWPKGEIDLVRLQPAGHVEWALEAKWSDRIVRHPEELDEALRFCRRNRVPELLVTTKTARRFRELEGIRLAFLPAAEYCYIVGAELISGRRLEVARSGHLSEQ
jgi:predicted AAA+ superfamily ATPase